jgi:hypothetical protein
MKDLKLRLKVDELKTITAALDTKLKRRLELYLNSLNESTEIVDVYLCEAETENGTNAQLAKVHALIRQLSVFTGHTTTEIKLLIKERIDFTNDDGSPKSFSVASKRELSIAIQECINLGQSIGLVLF